MLLTLSLIVKNSTYNAPVIKILGTPQKEFSWVEEHPYCLSLSLKHDICPACSYVNSAIMAFSDNRCIQLLDKTHIQYSNSFMKACFVGDCETFQEPTSYQYLKYSGVPSAKCVAQKLEECPLFCDDKKPIQLKQIINEYVFADVASIKNAIIKYGVLVTKMNIFEDFYNYDGGVYTHTVGEKVGLDYVNIIGFGEDFWLIRTNQGSEFGENGIMKVKIGQKQLQIEEKVTAFEVV